VVLDTETLKPDISIKNESSLDNSINNCDKNSYQEFDNKFIVFENKLDKGILNYRKAKKKGKKIVRSKFLRTRDIQSNLLNKEFLNKNKYIENVKSFKKDFIEYFNFLFEESSNIDLIRDCNKHAIVHYVRSVYLGIKYGLDVNVIKLVGIHDLIEDSSKKNDLKKRIKEVLGNDMKNMTLSLTNNKRHSDDRLENYKSYVDGIVGYCIDKKTYVPIKSKDVENIDNILTVSSLKLSNRPKRFEKTLVILDKTKDIAKADEEVQMLNYIMVNKSIRSLTNQKIFLEQEIEPQLYANNIEIFRDLLKRFEQYQ